MAFLMFKGLKLDCQHAKRENARSSEAPSNLEDGTTSA